MGQFPMPIKILFLTLLLSSCGREVKLTNNLESISQITQAEQAKYIKSGTLIRGSTDQVSTNGKILKVSIYSSHNALAFIKTIPAGAQVPIQYTGGINGSDIVLETIKRQ
jgi:hypothetical protein